MGEIENITQPEIRMEFNTGEGQVNFKTVKITGSLNSVIIDTKDKIEVVLESSLGYLIFKKVIEGIEYIAPRIKILSSEFDARDMLTFEKFKINEELLITILGPKNKEISVILRIDC